MHPILFRIGSFTVHSYTVLLEMGLACGLLIAYLEGRKRLLDPSFLIDASFYSILAGVFGARVGYVVDNWDYFSTHLKETLFIWKGGLSFHGAILAGFSALFAYAVYKKKGDFFLLADVVAISLTIGQVFGWLGCFMGGYAYGKESVGFLSFDLPDIYGVRALRFPTQPFGAALSLLIFLILIAIRRLLPIGFPFSLYLLLYFGCDFLLEFTRGDETTYIGALRIAQVIDIGLVVIALVLLVYLHRKRQKVPCLPSVPA
jgi:phosphatidylglycerol:prolipoprotein diacylglycerol transferase